MKVAVISGNREVVGGAETYVRWLLPKLLARGHELALGFEQQLVDVNRAIERDTPNLPTWGVPELGQEGWLRKLAGFEPDVVYVHGVTDPGLEAELARRFNAICYAHAYTGACATGTRSHTRPRVRDCQRRFGAPCLVTNFVLGCGARRPDTLLKSYRLQARRAAVLPNYRALAVATTYVRETYVRQGIPAHMVHVLPSPSLDFVRDPNPPAARALGNRVLFVGRLTPVKGLEHAVRATALAQAQLGRPLALVVAGEGPQLARCRALAYELGVELEALGWVEGERKRQVYREADALLVPSLWAEPFGIVGIEAGCVGLPAVGYPLGGIVDWLVPGRSGELCGPEIEPAGLAGALVRAIGSRDHWSSLRAGAWEMAADYTPENHLFRLDALFEQVRK